MSGRCLKGIYGMSEWYVRCLHVSEGQVKTSQVRISKVRTGQVRTGSDRCLEGVVMSGQVKSGKRETALVDHCGYNKPE